MTREPEPPSLAVLIDADNTSPRYATAIFEEIATLGEATVRRIYGDFSGTRLGGWDEAVRRLAILQHQSRSNTTGKNASDIALVIDAMDLMHKGKLDGVCLVSSDSDFTRLAQRLREDGLTVYGFGERKTPEAFRNACNRFIYVENLMDAAVAARSADAEARAQGNRPEPDPAPGRETRSTTGVAATEPTDTGGTPKEPASKAVPILMKAMAGLEDDDGWVMLSAVGSRVVQIAPDFDPRTYGHTKLSALVEKSGGFEMGGAGSGLKIRVRNPRRRSTGK